MTVRQNPRGPLNGSSMSRLILFFISLIPLSAFAHVKWFSDYNFQNPPLNLSDLNTPIFWGLFILSVVAQPAMVFLDHLADKSSYYHKTNQLLDQYSDQGPLIMRIAMGAVLLMSWQADSIIAPEISIPSPLWGWLQFLLALCLLFKRTTFITGLGIIFFYVMGISQQGIFHMLDYVIYPAVGLYLILSHLKSERFRNFDLPILYSGLGFSLCWVSFEKLIYPFWGLSVLDQAPALTMGLPHEFFLMSAAFVEFSLGYLLIICLLQRPLAIIITLVFFTTTVFFGKTEVVGHTILHGALLVFIVKGPGHYYQVPIRFHKSLGMRSLFAAVNFVILFVLFAYPYEKMARDVFIAARTEKNSSSHAIFEIPKGAVVPSVELVAHEDSMGGWNIKIETKNFIFTPENAGKDDVIGEGHAHLYVNGKKVLRVYGNWVHLNLNQGTNKVRVDLTTNSHKSYYFDGKLIASELEVEEMRASGSGHSH